MPHKLALDCTRDHTLPTHVLGQKWRLNEPTQPVIGCYYSLNKDQRANAWLIQTNGPSKQKIWKQLSQIQASLPTKQVSLSPNKQKLHPIVITFSSSLASRDYHCWYKAHQISISSKTEQSNLALDYYSLSNVTLAPIPFTSCLYWPQQNVW